MKYANIQAAFEHLKRGVRQGEMTPAKEIDYDTIVCLVSYNEKDKKKYYHQANFTEIGEINQRMLKGKRIGDTIGECKVMAIYHIWSEVS